MIEVVLFDFDGVVRRFPRNAQWHDQVGGGRFDPGLLNQAVTGKITDEEWHAEVLRRIGGAARPRWAAWSESAGEVNDAVLRVVKARTHACRSGLLTNGTTASAADLERLGITDEFDVIFNSCELGVAEARSRGLRDGVHASSGSEPASVFFVDDSPVMSTPHDAGM